MSTKAGTAVGSLIGADRAGVVCAQKFDEVRGLQRRWGVGGSGLGSLSGRCDGYNKVRLRQRQSRGC